MNKESIKGMKLLKKGLEITLEAWDLLDLNRKAPAEYEKMKTSLIQIKEVLGVK